MMMLNSNEFKSRPPQCYNVYTDGSCIANPGPGGYAAILVSEDCDDIIVSGGSPHTTNNRMELMAVIQALHRIENPAVINIYSDSQYVVKAFTANWLTSWIRNGWRNSKGPVKNKDLWLILLELVRKHHVKFFWVKGHSGNHYNEKCDELAVSQSMLYARTCVEKLVVEDI